MTAITWLGGLLAIPLAAFLMITRPRTARLLVLAVFALAGCWDLERSGTGDAVAFILTVSPSRP